eukprot:scaffold2201_cov240-Pinguiococcus_pyrenoidosus.AAC.4
MPSSRIIQAKYSHGTAHRSRTEMQSSSTEEQAMGRRYRKGKDCPLFLGEAENDGDPSIDQAERRRDGYGGNVRDWRGPGKAYFLVQPRPIGDKHTT